MLKKLSGFLFGFVLVMLIVGMIAFNALVLWVATGPRNLDALSPYIEQAFTPADGRFNVKIGKTLLIWDGWKHPIDMRINDVKVLTREGRVFSRFPEIKIGLDVLALLTGQVLPRSLVIEKPVIRLFQDEHYRISFGPQELIVNDSFIAMSAGDDERFPLAAILAPLLSRDDNGALRRLRSVHIGHAAVKILGAQNGVFFETRDTDFSLQRDRDGMMQLMLSARARYEEFQTGFKARFLIAPDQPDYNGYVEFSGLEPHTLLRLFSSSAALDPLAISLSGSSQITLSKEGEIDRLQFNVEGGDGTLNLPELPTIKTVPWLHAAGQVSEGFKEIHLDELSANISSVIMKASGTISLAKSGYALRGSIAAGDIPTEKVGGLWPENLAPLTREWVTSNITGGSVPQASVKLDIKPGDLEKPALPREAVDANITIEKTDIRYLPEHPEAKNVSALIHIDGVALDATIASADYMSATKISNTTVLIDDLNADNPYIKVNINAQSPAKDIARFLGLPRLKHADRLSIKEKEIEGNVKGSAMVGFNFFAPHDAQGNQIKDIPIDYDIKADVMDISQTGFMKKFDITKASGTIAINAAAVDFSGKATVNGAFVSDAKVKYLFAPEKGFDTFIDVKAEVPAESLARFGYPDFTFLSGKIGIDATLKSGADNEISTATINLADAAVKLTQLGWTKPLKQPAGLEITSEKNNGRVTIPAFHVKGKEVDFNGSASLAKDLTSIESVKAENITFGETKLDLLDYQSTDDGYLIDIKGRSLDLSGYFEHNDKSSESTFSFEHFPAVKFKGDIDRVKLSKKAEIQSFKGAMECSRLRCESANISGIAGKPFDIRILMSPKKTRQLSVRAQDAGTFLSAFNIFEGMEGGDLTITGNYEEGEKAALKARLDINQHVIKDAPVLAKILSLASLTGFFDTLQGKGIAFDKLNGKFTLKNDVMTLDNFRTHGSAMGMTIEGAVTMPKMLLDLQGTIVPSYSLNSALGKVPVVGELLTGGKGQGVFAARYSVKGTEQNPEVSVNPLSILTPGFLRGLFDIGSSDKKEAD